MAAESEVDAAAAVLVANEADLERSISVAARGEGIEAGDQGGRSRVGLRLVLGSLWPQDSREELALNYDFGCRRCWRRRPPLTSQLRTASAALL